MASDTSKIFKEIHLRACVVSKGVLVSVIIGAESVGQDAQKKELKLREKMVKEKFADKSLAFSLHQVSSGGFLQMLGFV